jgi:hypothetical protein
MDLTPPRNSYFLPVPVGSETFSLTESSRHFSQFPEARFEPGSKSIPDVRRAPESNSRFGSKSGAIVYSSLTALYLGDILRGRPWEFRLVLEG